MTFEEGSIYFNKIFVLQSLDDSERKTGTELHDDIISRRAWVNPNLETEMINLENKVQFIDKLLEIKNACTNNQVLPFLHFETHGFNTGLTLKSGEDIYWGEILPIISEINMASGNNLFISVASCFGGYIQFTINITQPCPFRGFIGPMDEIYNNDLLISFTAFFDTLLTTDDFEKAIISLNTSNTSGITFHHLNSEAFFDLVAKVNDDQFREDRINTIAIQNWGENHRVRLLFDNIDAFKEFIREVNAIITPQSIQIQRRRFLHHNTI